MPSRKVKLEICGSSYVVSTNDPEEYIVALAERLDNDMNRMLVEAPNASVTAAAVICALGYLDELEKSNLGADNMREQIQDYLEDAAKAKMAAEEARREMERLRREVSYYEGKGGAPAPKQPKAAQAAPAEEQEDEEDPEDINIAGQMGIEDL